MARYSIRLQRYQDDGTPQYIDHHVTARTIAEAWQAGKELARQRNRYYDYLTQNDDRYICIAVQPPMLEIPDDQPTGQRSLF